MVTLINIYKFFFFSLNNTYRCGVFVSEPGAKFEPPLVKYFVHQNYGITSCPAKFRDRYKKGTFSKKCAEMVINCSNQGFEEERNFVYFLT